MTSKQRAYLKSMAVKIEPVMQIDPLFLRDALRQILRYMKYDKETGEFHFYYKEPTNIS